jgi:hypothetical protein
LVDTEKCVQLPLVQDAVVSDDVDWPVVIDESGEELRVLAGLLDPHAAVTNTSVNPLPRRQDDGDEIR